MVLLLLDTLDFFFFKRLNLWVFLSYAVSEIPSSAVGEFLPYCQAHDYSLKLQTWQPCFATFQTFLELHYEVPDRIRLLWDWLDEPSASPPLDILRDFFAINPRFCFTCMQTLLICVFHHKSLVIVTPGHLILLALFRLYVVWIYLTHFLVVYWVKH